MSYRTSGEFRESKKMGSIGAGGGIGGREGADLRRDRRGLSAEEAIKKFSIHEDEKDE